LHQRRPFGPDRLVAQIAFQIFGQLPSRGIALGRVLGDRLKDDGFQVHRDGAIQFPGMGRVLESDLPQHRLAVRPVAGRLQG
jgi:protein involved in polysaccharide export with SLBB domain